MDRKHICYPVIFRKKAIKSIALAILLLTLVLVLYQFIFFKMMEDYNRRSIIEHDNFKVQTLLKPSQNEKDHFLCSAGEMSISIDKLNDDYCDCPDGSDEPKTNACPNGFFICEQNKVKISSSNVNDGICDCCDGSDEWKQIDFPIKRPIEIQKKTQIYNPPCPNTCTT